jgi:hypothetical protein
MTRAGEARRDRVAEPSHVPESRQNDREIVKFAMVMTIRALGRGVREALLWRDFLRICWTYR